MKFKNSNGDETQIVMKLKNTNSDTTQKLNRDKHQTQKV